MVTQVKKFCIPLLLNFVEYGVLLAKCVLRCSSLMSLFPLCSNVKCLTVATVLDC